MAESLDRDAVDRVLARAHRLESRSPDSGDGVDPDALVAAAAEVGMDPNAVRDSLAIEQLTIARPPARRLDGLAGPGELMVERELELTVEQSIAGVEAWLSSHYRLICDRRADGSLFARRRSDTSARVARVFSSARGDGHLAATAVVVQAVPQTVGTTPARPRTLLRIGADRTTPRQLRLAGGGSLAGVGVGGGAAAAATEAFVAVPIVAVPFAVGGFLVARSGRGHADRLELELERLLSRVERGEQPAGFLGRVARRARRAASGLR